MNVLLADSAAVAPLPWWVRILLVVGGLGIWFWTQRLLGERPPLPQEEERSAGRLLTRHDTLLRLLAPIHRYLSAHPIWGSRLLIVSSLLIDVMTLGLLLWSVFGPSLRPFLGLLVLFSMRQIFQALCQLPVPEGVIWHHPGFPSLVVTYGVSNDLFFSGHTALAVYGAIELGRAGPPWMISLAVLVAVFEIVTVLALRAHYTMDVYAGAITAAWVAILAAWFAPSCDQGLAELFARFL